jgi:REP element-mobilizing transposase RayT
LAGKDPLTGNDFSYRREWIRRRMEQLAAVFGIDVLAYAILSNHLHLVLRNRPDVVGTWSDAEVAQRWLQLFPGKRLDEQLGQPSDNEIQALARDTKRLAVIRTRLSDISWFMRALAEPIARMANRQDECTGRFWEGRFKAQRITDEAGLLAVSMYVDLNPVRAALARTAEQSQYTSAYDRIRGGLQGEQVPSAAAEVAPVSREQAAKEAKTLTPSQRRKRAAQRKRAARRGQQRIRRDAWLAELTIDELLDEAGPRASSSWVRASDKGFLSMSLTDYVELLEWTGRQGRKASQGQRQAPSQGTGTSGTGTSGTGMSGTGTSGTGTSGTKVPGARGGSESAGDVASRPTLASEARVPENLRRVLSRLGIEGSMWLDLVWNFKRYFGHSAGSPSSLKADAASRSRQWARGQRSASHCFTQEEATTTARPSA